MNINPTAASTIVKIDRNPIRIHTQAGIFEVTALLAMSSTQEQAPLSRVILGAAVGYASHEHAVAKVTNKLERGKAIAWARSTWEGKTPTGYELKDWADARDELVVLERKVAHWAAVVATLEEYKWALTAAQRLGM